MGSWIDHLVPGGGRPIRGRRTPGCGQWTVIGRKLVLPGADLASGCRGWVMRPGERCEPATGAMTAVPQGRRPWPLATLRSAGRSSWCASACERRCSAWRPAGGSKCQRAAAWRQGSRERNTSRCCCSGTAVRCTRTPCTPGRSRIPRGDDCQPTHQPGTTRPLPCACPPCRPFPSRDNSLSRRLFGMKGHKLKRLRDEGHRA